MNNVNDRLKIAFHRSLEKIRSLKRKTVIYAVLVIFSVSILISIPLVIVPTAKEYTLAQEVKQEATILKAHLQGASDKLQKLENLRKTSPFTSRIQSHKNSENKSTLGFVSVAHAQSSYDASKLESFIQHAQQTTELSNELLNDIKTIRETTVKLQEQTSNSNTFIDENLYVETLEQIKESEDSITATYEIAAFYAEYGKASALFATGIAKVEIQLQQKQDVQNAIIIAGQQLNEANEILAAINKNEAFPQELRSVSGQTQQSYTQLSKALTDLTLLSKRSSDVQVAYLQEEIVAELAVDYETWRKIESDVLDQDTINTFNAKAKELSQKVDRANQNQPSNLQVVIKVFTKEEAVEVYSKPAQPENQPTPTSSPTPTPIQVSDLGISISNVRTKFVMKAGESQSALTITSTGSSGISMYGYPTTYGPGINWSVSSAGLITGRSITVNVQVNSTVPAGTHKGNAIIISYPSGKRHTIPDIEVTIEKATGNPVVPTSTPNPTSGSNPLPTAGSTATPAQPQIGLQINTSSVDLTIEDGKSAKVFDITSIGASGFSLYGYPTSYGPGINWSVSSGGITSGNSTPVSIQVNSGINPGTYSGTGIVKDQNGMQISVPVKVTVVRTQASRFVKVTSPNGGEAVRVGDTVSIQWEGNDIDKCNIGYSFGIGSLNDIASFYPTSGNGSYEWTVNIGNTTNTQVKIDLLCYKTGVGQVSDQSDNFFTVNP